jgi:hypothetical protein
MTIKEAYERGGLFPGVEIDIPRDCGKCTVKFTDGKFIEVLCHDGSPGGGGRKYDGHSLWNVRKDSPCEFTFLSEAKSIKTTMSSLLSKIRGAFEQEPEKSLKHFGFMNESGDLTADGKEVLLNLLFKANPEIFNEAITKLKEEEEAAKK